MVAFRCVWDNKLLKILAKSWKSAIAFTYVQYVITASADYNSLVQFKKKMGEMFPLENQSEKESLKVVVALNGLKGQFLHLFKTSVL